MKSKNGLILMFNVQNRNCITQQRIRLFQGQEIFLKSVVLQMYLILSYNSGKLWIVFIKCLNKKEG